MESKTYKSIVRKEMINYFYPDHEKNEFSLYDYAAWKCGIDGMIAACAMLDPEIIYYDGYVLIKEFLCVYPGNDIQEKLKNIILNHPSSKKEVEMLVNTCNVGDLFLGKEDAIYDNMDVIDQFADCLKFFWEKKVGAIFPEKKIIVEILDESSGEFGKNVTLYEDDDNI